MYLNWKLSLQLLAVFAIISASSADQQNDNHSSPIQSPVTLARNKRFIFSGPFFSVHHMVSKMSNIMSFFGIDTTYMFNLQKIYNSAFSQNHLLFKRKILNLIMRTCNFILGYLPNEPVQPHSWFTKDYRLSYQTQRNQPGRDIALDDNLVEGESINIDFVDAERPGVVTQKVLTSENQRNENIAYLDLTSNSDTNPKLNSVVKRKIRSVHSDVEEILRKAIKEAEILQKITERDETYLEHARKRRSLHLNVNFAASKNYNSWRQTTTTVQPPIEIQKNVHFGLNWGVRTEHRHHNSEYQADDYANDDIFLRKRRDSETTTDYDDFDSTTTTKYSGRKEKMDLITESYSDLTTVQFDLQKEDNTISIEEITTFTNPTLEDKYSEVEMEGNKERLMTQMGKAYFPAEIILTHTTKPNQNQERTENKDSVELTESGEVKEEDPAHQLLFLIDNENSGSEEVPQEIIVDNHMMTEILDEALKITEMPTTELIMTTTELVDRTDFNEEDNRETAEVGTTIEQNRSEDSILSTTTDFTTLFTTSINMVTEAEESKATKVIKEVDKVTNQLGNLEGHVGIQSEDEEMTTEFEVVTTTEIDDETKTTENAIEVDTKLEHIGSAMISKSPTTTDFIAATTNIVMNAETTTVIPKLDNVENDTEIDNEDDIDITEMEEKVASTTELLLRNEVNDRENIAITTEIVPNSEATTFVTTTEKKIKKTMPSIHEINDNVEGTTLQPSTTSNDLEKTVTNEFPTTIITTITESFLPETRTKIPMTTATAEMPTTESPSTTTPITTITPSRPKPSILTTTEEPISLVFPQGYAPEEVDQLTKNLMHHRHLKHLAEGKHLNHIILKLAHDVGLNNLELIMENIENRLENHDKKLMVLVRKKKMSEEIGKASGINSKLMEKKDDAEKQSAEIEINERLIRQVESNEKLNLRNINKQSNESNRMEETKDDSLPLPISLLQQQEIQEMQSTAGSRSERKRLFVSNTTPSSSSFVPILTSSPPSTSPNSAILIKNDNILQIPQQPITTTLTNSTGVKGTGSMVAPSMMIQNMQQFMNKIKRRRKRPQMSMSTKMLNMTENSEITKIAMTEKIDMINDQEVKHEEHVTELIKPIDVLQIKLPDKMERKDETKKPTTSMYHNHKEESQSSTTPVSTQLTTRKPMMELMHSKPPMNIKPHRHHHNSEKTEHRKKPIKKDDNDDYEDDYNFSLDDIYNYFSSYGEDEDDDDSEEISLSQKTDEKHLHQPTSSRKDGKRSKRYLIERFRNTLDNFKKVTNYQHFRDAFTSSASSWDDKTVHQHYNKHNHIQNSAPYPPAQYEIYRKPCVNVGDNGGWTEYNSAVGSTLTQYQNQFQKQTQNNHINNNRISQNVNNNFHPYTEFSALPKFNPLSEFNAEFTTSSTTSPSTAKFTPTTTIPTTTKTTTTTTTLKSITEVSPEKDIDLRNTNIDLIPPKTTQPSTFKVIYDKEKHLNDLTNKNSLGEEQKQVFDGIIQEIEFNLLPWYVKSHQFKSDTQTIKESQNLHAEITRIVEETLQNNLWKLKNPENFKPMPFQLYKDNQKENKEKKHYNVKEIFSYKNEEQDSYAFSGYLLPTLESVTEIPTTRSPIFRILETTTTDSSTGLEDEDVRIIIKDEIDRTPSSSAITQLDTQNKLLPVLTKYHKMNNGFQHQNFQDQLYKLKPPMGFSAVTPTHQNSESNPDRIKILFNSFGVNQINEVEENLKEKMESLKKATEVNSGVEIDRLQKLEAPQEITKVIEAHLQNQLQNLKKQIDFNSKFGENLAHKEITSIVESQLQGQLQNLKKQEEFNAKFGENKVHKEITIAVEENHQNQIQNLKVASNFHPITSTFTANHQSMLAIPNNLPGQVQNVKIFSDLHPTTSKLSTSAANQQITNIIQMDLQGHLQKLRPTLNFNPKPKPSTNLTPNRAITLVIQDNLDGQLQNLKPMIAFQPVALSRLETQKIEVKTISGDIYKKQPFLSSVYDPNAIKKMMEQGHGPDGLFLSSVYVPPMMRGDSVPPTTSTTTTTNPPTSRPLSSAEKQLNLTDFPEVAIEKRLKDNKKNKNFEESIKFLVGGLGDAFLTQSEPQENKPETSFDLSSRFGDNSDGQLPLAPPLIHVSQSQNQPLNLVSTQPESFQSQAVRGSNRFTDDDTDVLIFSRFGNENDTNNKTSTEKPLTTSELPTTLAPSSTSIHTTYITSTSMVTEKLKQFRAIKPKNNIVVNYIYKKLPKESHTTLEPTQNHSETGPRRGDIIESVEDIDEEVDDQAIKALHGSEKDKEEERRGNVIIEEIKAQQLVNLQQLPQSVHTSKIDSVGNHTNNKEVDVKITKENKKIFPEHVKEVNGDVRKMEGEVEVELENIFGVAESDSDHAAIIKVLNLSNFGEKLMT